MINNMSKVKAYVTLTFPVSFEDDGETVLEDQAYEAAMEKVISFRHEVDDVKVYIDESKHDK